jgi:hypothetical protein
MVTADAAPTLYEMQLRMGLGQRPNFLSALLEAGVHRPHGAEDAEDSDTSSHNVTSPSEDRVKHYYKFFAFPKHFIKVRFDRLALLALLDRCVNATATHAH